MRVATIETATAEAESRDKRPAAGIAVLTSAELAECTCPESCDRDHERD